MLRKAPLKSYTTLKAKTPLRSYKPLKANSSLNSYSTLKTTKSLNKISEKRKKHLQEVVYESIFTDRMDICYITGATENVDPHHIFGGPRKRLSEKYHFMLPLRRDFHEGTNYSIHQDREFELEIKKKCFDYYISVLKKTREEWIQEFDMVWPDPKCERFVTWW